MSNPHYKITAYAHSDGGIDAAIEAGIEVRPDGSVRVRLAVDGTPKVSVGYDTLAEAYADLDANIRAHLFGPVLEEKTEEE